MSESTVTGNAAPAHPCARGIWSILPFIDVRGFELPEPGEGTAV